MTKYTDLSNCRVCAVAQRYQDAGIDNSVINMFIKLASVKALAPYREQIEESNAVILDEFLSDHVIAFRAANDMLAKGLITMEEFVGAAASGRRDKCTAFWERVMQYAKTMKAH